MKDHDSFSIASARHAIADLFTPKPWIYWLDFLFTWGAGIYCFREVHGGPLYLPHQGFRGDFWQVFFFVASVFLFYRAVMFIHEVVHQRPSGRLPVFRMFWNLLCGIPFLIPSFIYYTHIDHHRRKHFGTDRDGEYVPLAKRPIWHALFFVSWGFVVPLLGVFRFTVLTPLAWCIPGFRQFVHQHASSMVMDPTYIRPLPTKQTMRMIYLQEAACFLWCVGVAISWLVIYGGPPVALLVHVYLLSFCIITINAIRTLGSHRWHNDGGEMTFEEQLLDSVNYPSYPLISELWGPVGTRFHALHHLFPSLPYHAMPAAHRRLIATLPADSPYRRAEERSLTGAIMQLWRKTQKHSGGHDASDTLGVDAS